MRTGISAGLVVALLAFVALGVLVLRQPTSEAPTAAAAAATSSPTTHAPATTAPTSTTKPTPAPTITVKTAGQQYVNLVNPVNAAISAFRTKANGWSNSTTSAQAEADAQPLISALQNLQNGLLHDQWPAAAGTDVKAVVQAIAPVTGDLEGLASVNLLNASSWSTTFQRDEASMGTAANVVRSDLGLPSAS
jgi:hypothetical protein